MKEANHTKYCKRTSQEERAARAKVLVHKKGWCVQRTERRSVWLKHRKKSDGQGEVEQKGSSGSYRTL